MNFLKKKKVLKQQINLKEAFENIKKNSIYIEYQDSHTNKIGRSKFGGNPHLPKDFVWPYFKGNIQDGDGLENIENRPLSFFMQINCDEIRDFDLENKLPQKGILYFFYEMQTQTWGFDPMDKGSAVVYYYAYDNINELIEIQPPKDLDNEFIFKERAINFKNKYDVPSYEEYIISNDFDDWSNYFEEMERLHYQNENSNTNKLLGYADFIQGEMLTECQLASNGIYCGSPEYYEFPKAKELMKSTNDWILLAQIGSSIDDNNLMFGDCGNIFFYIKKEDLANKNFSNIWLILQCG